MIENRYLSVTFRYRMASAIVWKTCKLGYDWRLFYGRHIQHCKSTLANMTTLEHEMLTQHNALSFLWKLDFHGNTAWWLLAKWFIRCRVSLSPIQLPGTFLDYFASGNNLNLPFEFFFNLYFIHLWPISPNPNNDLTVAGRRLVFLSNKPSKGI